MPSSRGTSNNQEYDGSGEDEPHDPDQAEFIQDDDNGEMEGNHASLKPKKPKKPKKKEPARTIRGMGNNTLFGQLVLTQKNKVTQTREEEKPRRRTNKRH